MFDSKPRDREGEPVESLVPQAISVTASEAREGDRGPAGRLPGWVPSSRAAFAVVAALAVLEALALVLLLILVALLAF